MTSCDLETSIPDWILEHPQTWTVFQELGIDTSCGGKSLDYVCDQAGLDPALVLEKLHQCLKQNSTFPR